MPIYEFKCLECNEYFEILVARIGEDIAMECPKCHAENFERVMSTTNYAMGVGAGVSSDVKAQTRKCSSGSCTTYEVPGMTR